jgi:hypothetical protein
VHEQEQVAGLEADPPAPLLAEPARNRRRRRPVLDQHDPLPRERRQGCEVHGAVGLGLRQRDRPGDPLGQQVVDLDVVLVAGEEHSEAERADQHHQRDPHCRQCSGHHRRA